MKKRVALIGVTALGIFTMPVFGGAILTNGTYYEFTFGTATSAVQGCSPGTNTCSATTTPAALQTPDPPWTFSLAGTGTLFITDIGHVGDRFNVYDVFGANPKALLGGTSVVPNPNLTNPCGTNSLDVACAVSKPFEYSNASFILAAGNHTITMDVIQNAGGTEFGQAVFNVTAAAASVPEPSTFLLLGAGIAGLGFVRRRKSRC